MPRQVERHDAIAGVAIGFDQGFHVFGARAPAVQHQHGAGAFPALRGRNSCTITQRLPTCSRWCRASSMKPAARPTARLSPSERRFGLGVRQNSSNAAFPAIPRRDMLGSAEQAADDLDAD